jgi:hypothetical protein
MEGRLVGEWAEQARCLVTTDLVPKGLIVDLNEISYVDAVRERLLSWLGSIGAVFAVRGVFTTAICERVGLSLMHRMPARRHWSKEQKASNTHPMQVDADPGGNRKEKQ